MTMRRRRGLPCLPSPPTHTIFFIVFFAVSYFVRGTANASIFLLQSNDNNEEEARSPSSPVSSDARRIFGCIFVYVVFLADAQPILVFFLRPNNYNDEEASIAYVSILLMLVFCL